MCFDVMEAYSHRQRDLIQALRLFLGAKLRSCYLIFSTVSASH